jgi:uncharacterized protein involved in exopolysaccharide biosynthesis
MAAVAQRLAVGQISNSSAIAIRFTSTDPSLAATFVDRLAETYKTQVEAGGVADTEPGPPATGQRMSDDVRREIAAIEFDIQALSARRTAQPPPGAETAPEVSDPRLPALLDAQARAELARKDAEAQLQAVRDAIRANISDTLPDVQRSATLPGLTQQRAQLERQIAEAGATLLPGHPRMKQLQGDLSALKQQIQGELQKIVAGYDSTAKAAAAKAEAAKRQVEAARTPAPVVSAQPSVEDASSTARLAELTTALDAKRRELESLSAVESPAPSQVLAPQGISVQILSRAQVVNAGGGLRKGQIATLTFALVLLGGMGLVVVREMRRDRGRAPVQQESRGTVSPPVARGGRGAASNGIATLDDVLPSIMAARPERGGRRTLVVGSGAASDVAQEANALASTCAAAGESVILMQWDLNGRAAGLPQFESGRKGINDVLMGGALFDEVISPLGRSGVHALPAGAKPATAAAVLDPDMLNMAFDALDETYDHFIVFGARADATQLFKALEGRFDVALEVLDSAPASPRKPDEILGFQVTGIAVLRCQPMGARAKTAPVAAPKVREGVDVVARPAKGKARSAA